VAILPRINQLSLFRAGHFLSKRHFHHRAIFDVFGGFGGWDRVGGFFMSWDFLLS
jgi:hypothetical protein